MSEKRTNKQYPAEFKEEAVALIHEQGYSVSEAAKSLGIGTSLLYKWKELIEAERGSLKHDWIFKQHQPTREHMEKDVAAFMRYYNLERLPTANDNMSPINYESSLKYVSGWT